MRALAYEAVQRYETAEQLGEALTGYLHLRGAAGLAEDVRAFYEQHFQDELKEHQETLSRRCSRASAGHANDQRAAGTSTIRPIRWARTRRPPLETTTPRPGPTKIDTPTDEGMAIARAADRASPEPDVGDRHRPAAPAAAPPWATPDQKIGGGTDRDHADHQARIERARRIDPIEHEDAAAAPSDACDQRLPSPVAPGRRQTGPVEPTAPWPATGGRRPWVYPLVFLAAPGAGAGILLLALA